MIDEQDLYALRDGAGPLRRPLDDVQARGNRLRRRRQAIRSAIRSAGLGAVVVGVIGASFLATRRDGGSTDEVSTRDNPTTTDVPSSPPPTGPSAIECLRRDVHESPDTSDSDLVDAADVPDALRVLPTFHPDGVPLTSAQGHESTSTCESVPEPADPAMALNRVGTDGVTRATIALSGPLPYDRSELGSDGTWPSGSTATQVPFRGVTATRVDYGGDAGIAFYWKEADGWSWALRGDEVDAATLAAVGAALELDSSPEGNEPVATLPDGAQPDGFDVAWQTRGVPKLYPKQPGPVWDVQVGGSLTGPNTGIECMVETSARAGDMPTTAAGGVGTHHVTISGKDAVWDSDPRNRWPLAANLIWEISPGVVARAGCIDWDQPGITSLPLETVLRFAESVAPVPADDPRIPH